MIASNSYTFRSSEKNNIEKTKLNIGPLIFGAVALVSNFYFGNNVDSTLLSNEVNTNSIYSVKLNNENTAEKENISNQTINSDGVFTLNLTKDAIIKSDTIEEMEGVDVEELRKLQDSFERFSTQNHEQQLKVTELLATLTAEMKSVNSELTRLNKSNEELPDVIKREINNINVEKSKNKQSTWIAPLVVGIIVLVGQYLLGMI